MKKIAFAFLLCVFCSLSLSVSAVGFDSSDFVNRYTEHFSFSTPSNWLSKEDGGNLFFYGKSIGSVAGGYLFVYEQDYTNKSYNPNDLSVIYQSFIKGLSSSANDNTMYSEDLRIGNDHAIIARYDQTINGTVFNFVCIGYLKNGYFLTLAFSDTELTKEEIWERSIDFANTVTCTVNPPSMLNLNLDTANLDELKNAKEIIENRISELQSSEPISSSEIIEISGSGTSIISDITIPFSPSRIIVNCDGKLDGELIGDTNFSFSANTQTAKFFDGSGSFDFLVEASGDWSISIEPIVYSQTFPISGTGEYVSDFFDLDSPMIVTVKGDPSTSSSQFTNLIFKLHHQYEYLTSWGYDALTNEFMSQKDDQFVKDVILKPVNGRDQYCISITCDPGVQWSIETKK